MENPPRSPADEVTLDHDALDGDHRALFRLLATALDAAVRGARAPLVAAIGAFADEAAAHLAAEDRLMEESRYPDRARHRAAHDLFLADVQRLRAESDAQGPSLPIVEALRVRVPEWLRFHILMNDAPLARHLASRPGGEPAERPARTPGTRGSSRA